MFWWLGLALLVDGIDGPIARKAGGQGILPTWSGDTLDNIIDYVTYVLHAGLRALPARLDGRALVLSFLSAASSSCRARSTTPTWA
jgi:phosphatidylserine synthase